MKWSEEKVGQLKTLAQAGASNSLIATKLGISVTDVYAKRSQLGITIDKVKTSQSGKATTINQKFEKAVQEMDTEAAAPRELNAKQDLIRLLEPAIIKADKSVKHLELASQGRKVLIDRGDHGITVDIEGDSLLAIIADVTRKCLF